jgi:flagellar hook-associated protein 2
LSSLSSSYGTNTSTTSSGLSSYLVGIKEAAADITSSVETARKTSTWESSSLSSDSSDVSVSYSGSDKIEDMSVTVKALAQGQVNEGKDYISTASTIKSTSFSIETADGKKKNFFIATGSSVTNEEVQQKAADKINSANLGITASVEKDSKTGASRLVLTGKTGEGNDYTVSGSLAEDLGITSVTQEAQDAVYSINSGEDEKSSSNTIKVSDDLSLTLNKVSETPSNITYSKNTTGGINAARELVNSYNALYSAAKKYDDTGSLQLQSKMVSLDSTYAASLERIGITTNSQGYLEIDEDKMKEAADDGTLEKFFNNDKGKNYGFVNRLEQLSESISSDPSKYLSSSAKEELNSSDSSSYTSLSSSYLSSSRFRRSYFNYISTSALFDALF